MVSDGTPEVDAHILAPGQGVHIVASVAIASVGRKAHGVNDCIECGANDWVLHSELGKVTRAEYANSTGTPMRGRARELIEVLVPMLTCMQCGTTFDGSKPPQRGGF